MTCAGLARYLARRFLSRLMFCEYPHRMAKQAPRSSVAAGIEAIFHPRSIAVVGASANPDTPGFDYVRSLQEFGYGGRIYPINPKGGEILGLPVYASLRDIPGGVDYVISCIPNAYVLDLVQDCAAVGVKALQLFTGRFSETGRADDAALEDRLHRTATEAGVRLIGPNCMGLLYPELGISFRTDMSRKSGPIGFLSQSGNLLFELTHFGESRGLRFSKAISYGNALDLNESDFLEYFAEDTETHVIGAYVEGVRDGRAFMEALRQASSRKPTVVLKGGRTDAGGRTAVSHTAALAGSAAVWDAALRQSGAIGVETVEELIDVLIACAYMKPKLPSLVNRNPSTRSGRYASRTAQGERPKLGMVGAGGGRSVLTADLCEELGLSVPPLPPDVEAKVAEKAPDLAGWVTNPVDQSILAGSGLGGAQVLEWLDESPEIDMLVGNIGEPWAFGRPNGEAIVRRVTERFIEVAAKTKKPFAVVLGPSDYGDESRWRVVSEARERLVEASVAVFPSVERAVRTLARLGGYWSRRLD
jgi:acyl-CoA synthetase (NDP forming)